MLEEFKVLDILSDIKYSEDTAEGYILKLSYTEKF